MKRDDPTEKLLDARREKGWPWKHIRDEFGDGILSDFDATTEREPSDEGDGVKPGMSGKLPPCKYHGNGDGVPDYGFKGP